MRKARLRERRAAHDVAEDERGPAVTIHAPHRFVEEIAGADGRSPRFAVNLGAGDGVSCNDPVFPLYEAGWPGIAVEGEHDEQLLANLPAPAIRKLIDTLVTPGNVVQLLVDHGCPESPGLLKIDIDGYDGHVLLEILRAGFRPRVIQLEVQPEIPPPIEFAVLYHPDYRPADRRGRVGGFYGASLAYLSNVGRRFGYFPAQVDFVTAFTHDVTLVADRYRDLVSERFGIVESDDRELYLAQPPGYAHFEVDDGIDSEPWRITDDYPTLMRAIREACVTSCRRKHGTLLPFHLALA